MMNEQEALNRAAAEVEAAEARVLDYRDRTPNGAAHDRLVRTVAPPMIEVGKTSRGYTIWKQDNEVGGLRYWSDSIGGGVMIWDTALASIEELQFCIALEQPATPPDSPALDLGEIERRQIAARKMVHALCQPRGSEGSREWIMSIPVNFDRDPDVIIGASLADVPALIARIRHLEGEAEEHEAQIESALMAAAETQPSWGARVSRVLAAIGSDFGGPDVVDQAIRTDLLRQFENEGYKLVPVEPTDEMIIAAQTAAADGFISPVYRAMLSAAPSIKASMGWGESVSADEGGESNG